MATDYSKPPLDLKWRSHTLFIISTVALGLFTDLFLYGLVVPILPFILSDRLHVPHSEIQTYTSILLACFAASSVLFSLPIGIIADRLSTRQLPFLVGLFALLASTILLYLGQSIAILILARILQGMSAAVVWTIGLAMVMDTVGSEKLGVTIGSISGIISVGELVAPVLGGVVYKKAGSGAVFGMGFGLLAIDFVMRLAIIEKKAAKKYGCDEQEGEERDEEADESTALLSNGLTKNENLEEWKIGKDQPFWIRKLPILYCLGNKRLLTAQLVAFIQATLLGTFDATIPTEAQDLWDFDSLKAGLLFVPQVLPYLLLGPICGKGVDKYGARLAAGIGLAYITIPLILLRIPQPGGTAEIVKYCVLLALTGLGLALISAPSIVEASYVIEQYHKANKDFFGENGPYAQLYAINSMCFSLGLTFGPLLAGSLRDSIGYGNMNAVIAGLCAVVSVLSFMFLGKIPKVVES
ncbi:MFS transporter-like protein [Mollisia scopiformis]|uniref:MFS transporter-like protein n=1 Tax=Mollisia scopiformis TaxID=149040 RepID=A0A194XIK3_MOLSC|nr:MFS transporter-like protein [Mollisia scopiformis]KUJ19597.1 MFS transporter-like protein [Mollisia scopiformis]